ncbi:FMRFamide receptor-like [Pecten maximus]|uniref:FMRFamide receptor-like n=1 Tax=Pecten maximus TaxID=6579 RepID=UPI001458CC5B|nr:FMRFamide receptor-like [Pecten maximus]
MNCTELFIHLNFTQRTQNVSISPQMVTLQLMKYYLYDIVIPLVCAFGFVGNILNVVIFTKKKNNKILDEVEYCTTICLVALAVSDMMFCLCTFPNAFLPERGSFHRSEFMLFYKMYSIAVISTFILSSTLLTVLTAFMRYLAICHPFRSRQFISVKITGMAIVVIAVTSIGFNIPSLWRFKQESLPCFISQEYVSTSRGDLFNNINFVYAHKLLWAILGNFLPLAILLYCNICLIRALHQSKQLRLLHSRDDTTCLSAHRRINITLITIIIFFFILVAPSEITKFFFYIIKEYQRDRHTYEMVSMVTNTLQTINFSVNFILYYVIIAPFRKTLHEFVCALSRHRRSTETREHTSNSGKHTIMLLSIKEQQQNCI